MIDIIGYHTVYKKENFSKELLEATRELGLEPMKKDITNYIKVIGELYGIDDICKVTIKTTKSPLNEGVYVGVANEIIFYTKPSLITILHEIRHFIQKKTDLNYVDLSYEDKELDARAWSSSLFYALYPEKYLYLCEKNLIKYK